jgi:hypothetical protein
MLALTMRSPWAELIRLGNPTLAEYIAAMTNAIDDVENVLIANKLPGADVVV